MDIKIIVIIGLLALSYYQFFYPEASHIKLEPLWSKIPAFNLGSIAQENTTQCPDTESPVCGSDGVTYKNICLAAIANILEVKPGAC